MRYPPVFELADGWYFVEIDGKRTGPYSTKQRAEDKYYIYEAYVVTAPLCHHPEPR